MSFDPLINAIVSGCEESQILQQWYSGKIHRFKRDSETQEGVYLVVCSDGEDNHMEGTHPSPTINGGVSTSNEHIDIYFFYQNTSIAILDIVRREIRRIVQAINSVSSFIENASIAPVGKENPEFYGYIQTIRINTI